MRNPVRASTDERDVRQPHIEGGQVKRQAIPALVVAVLGLVAALISPAAAASTSSMSPLWRFADGQAVVGAWSSLVRTDKA